MAGCDVPVTTASIRHLARSFVLTRAGDYQGLFADRFVDAEVRPLIASHGDVVDAARETLAGDEPVRAMGTHCDAPFSCSFKRYCSRDLATAPDWPVSLLPDQTGKRIVRDWIERGIDDLMLVSADAMPSPKLRRIHAATVTGEPWHDHAAIAAETAGWAYPRIFLDFETTQHAVPRWVGTKPYQQVPFQFSAHVMAADGSITHSEFLSLDGADPRRACAVALAALADLGGTVIAWNMAFEGSCILALAADFADFASALQALAARLVDLLPIVRRHYYHRDMRGSWSIKAVLPTVAPDLGYDGLSDVKSGTDAQAGYLEAIDPLTAPAPPHAHRSGAQRLLPARHRGDDGGARPAVPALSSRGGEAAGGSC